MSIGAMKLALEALQESAFYLASEYTCVEKECEAAITALRAAIEQAQTGSAQSGLAEKVPAKGTLLEQTLRRVWDEMPHTAVMDAIIGGTGVMLGDKRIDPASIYKQPEQEPVAWVCYGSASDEKHTIDYRQEDIDAIPVGTMLYPAPRQWQGLTDEDVDEVERWIEFKEDGSGRIPTQKLVRYIEAKLKAKNS